jgi:hypothetical protein
MDKIRPSLASAVALSLIVICSGCGKSGPKKIPGPEVVQAFAKSGLALDDSLGGIAGVVTYDYLPPKLLESGGGTTPLDVEVFSSIGLAHKTQAYATVLDDKGNPILPFAKVANVQVNLTTKDRTLRRKVAAAVARLRELANG